MGSHPPPPTVIPRGVSVSVMLAERVWRAWTRTVRALSCPALRFARANGQTGPCTFVPQGQRSARLKVIASKGRMLIGSSSFRARNQEPLSFVQLERLEGAVRRVHEPQMPDSFAGIDRGACHADQLLRVEAESTSHTPIRREAEVRRVRQIPPSAPGATPRGRGPGCPRRGAAPVHR